MQCFYREQLPNTLFSGHNSVNHWEDVTKKALDVNMVCSFHLKEVYQWSTIPINAFNLSEGDCLWFFWVVKSYTYRWTSIRGRLWRHVKLIRSVLICCTPAVFKRKTPHSFCTVCSRYMWFHSFFTTLMPENYTWN